MQRCFDDLTIMLMSIQETIGELAQNRQLKVLCVIQLRRSNYHYRSSTGPHLVHHLAIHETMKVAIPWSVIYSVRKLQCGDIPFADEREAFVPFS
jgi:hypothetical protein